jgi:hypothetical protein
MRVHVTFHRQAADRISMLRDICDEVDQLARVPHLYRVTMNQDPSSVQSSPAHDSIPSAS